MTQRADRKPLIDEISELQEQQLKAQRETALQGYTAVQSLRAFDARFNRMASLMHRLAKLDELENK